MHLEQNGFPYGYVLGTHAEHEHHLRAMIGPQEYLKKFVCEEVSDLISEVVQLAEFP